MFHNWTETDTIRERDEILCTLCVGTRVDWAIVPIIGYGKTYSKVVMSVRVTHSGTPFEAMGAVTSPSCDKAIAVPIAPKVKFGEGDTGTLGIMVQEEEG